ncbi:MAG: LytTR family DNA-binding domain-containing protein [Mycobacteriaceae bacterium]
MSTNATVGPAGDAPALSVLAVDDEPPALDELAYLLRANALVGEVHTATDATEALRLLRSHDVVAPVDVVFLDIRMPGLDGVELAGVLSAFAQPPVVVFVSAHDDRAMDAYEVGAVDYLLKPLSAHRLAESLRRIQLQRVGRGSLSDGGPVSSGPADSGPVNKGEANPGMAAAEDVIAAELGGTTTLVSRSEVRWVEAQGDYARLHTLTGTHLVRIPLSVLEERWRDVGFLRVHRSYLVALHLVTELQTTGTSYVVRLGQRGTPGAVELPVSRRHTRELKDRLVRTVKQSWTTR